MFPDFSEPGRQSSYGKRGRVRAASEEGRDAESLAPELGRREPRMRAGSGGSRDPAAMTATEAAARADGGGGCRVAAAPPGAPFPGALS